MCEFYCSTNLQVPETRSFYTLNVAHPQLTKAVETRPRLEGEIFLTSNDFWRIVSRKVTSTLHQGWFLMAFPDSDAMGYDLVKLKHFDMREIYVGKYYVAETHQIRNFPKWGKIKQIWKGTTHITINILGTTMHHPSKMNPWKCNKQNPWVTLPNGDQESTGPSLVACASWYLMELYYSFPQPGAFCAWMDIDFWIFRRRCVVYTACIPLITEHSVFTTGCFNYLGYHFGFLHVFFQAAKAPDKQTFTTDAPTKVIIAGLTNTGATCRSLWIGPS